jgi:nitrate reductase gamma subunit
MPLIQITLYLGLAILIIGTALKAFKISEMPVHLRWDLYPIPHEKGREHYGGSYYEETDWWTKPRNVSLVSEIKEMGREILAIQSLFRKNRQMWYFSFPFHIGLYLLTAFAGLLFLGAGFQERGIQIVAASESMLGRGIYFSALIIGAAGWTLGTIGAIGLLMSRIFKGELRRYSTRSDYFNLLLLLALFSSGIFAWITVDKYFSALCGFVQQLMLFRPARNLPSPVAVQLYLTAIFFAYLPFTHMTHFVGKYFSYHKVRWQDEPNRKGSETEKAIMESLGNVQDWSAPHIKTGKTWAAAATETENNSKSTSTRSEKDGK